MPEMLSSHFGRGRRFDGKPGYCEIVPTTMKFAEADNTDVRLRRVRVYGPDGNLVKTYLMDMMGVPFEDLPDVADDLEFLKSLT